jgi:hypothetical protein
MEYDNITSTKKARRAGFHDCIDTEEKNITMLDHIILTVSNLPRSIAARPGQLQRRGRDQDALGRMIRVTASAEAGCGDGLLSRSRLGDLMTGMTFRIDGGANPKV